MTRTRAPGTRGRDLATFAAAEGQALTRFAYLLTGDASQAEDLVQSVLLQLTRRGTGDLEDPASYARRALVNLHRSLGRRSAAYLRAVTRLGTPERCSTDSDAVERDGIWRALDVLSPRQRAAVILRYYEDWSDDQIAEALSCAPGTVRSLVSQSLPRLREQLMLSDRLENEGERA